MSSYVEVHIEVNDLHFATSLAAGEGAILDEDDIFALSDWVQRTVTNVLQGDEADE